MPVLSRRTLLASSALLAVVPVPSVRAQVDLFKFGSELLNKGATPGTATGTGTLSGTDIAAGLREALRVGADRVVARLGRPGGFANDPAVHIPLPSTLRKVQALAARFGMSGLFDDLDARLNRAAEVATPKAKAIFWNAIKSMTLDDARAIYNGPEDAATRYFQRKMTPDLTAAMRPVVQDSLSQVGAVRSYDQAMASYRKLPLVPDVKANLTDYVVTKGLDGIFHYMAQEEAAIRTQPLARTTDLLKRVFGAR